MLTGGTLPDGWAAGIGWRPVRVLIFHGYLLGGTGSNVYNARLAASLVRLGHEVHLLTQERHPEEHPFVDAAGDWVQGALRVRALHEPVRCTVYRPDIGGLLPVYVQDRYEGLEARTFSQCSPAEVERYVEANVAAVREVAARARPDVALANHLVMGPAILARALPDTVPYAVKVHGSALEYTVKPHPERFLGLAREGVARARGVLVGSLHTAESLWATLADPALVERTRLGPPGVDVERFAPRERAQAVAGVRALTARLHVDGDLPHDGGADSHDCAPISAFARDERAAAAALARLDLERDRLVAFVGKLIASKGVDLLLQAWSSVLAREPAARLLVVGFGAERERFEAAAAPLGERVVFTGRLDHEELAELLPACEALVVPSTFPEAFGMVAVEAAACGVLPISAAHSGLAEVSEVLARAVPAEVAPLLSFPVDDGAVRALSERIYGWLRAAPALRAEARAGLVATARERWSWEGVARGVIAAARGDLDTLEKPR
jgi:glycosyltransferase involved in cell wall biosynthesis